MRRVPVFDLGVGHLALLAFGLDLDGDDLFFHLILPPFIVRRQDRRQFSFQFFVAKPLFLFPEVRFAELLRAVFVIERFGELFARQVEHPSPDGIEAVNVPVRERHAVHLAAVDILHKERRDGALPPGLVLLRPVGAHPARAGLPAPEAREQIVVVAGRQSQGVLDVRRLPTVKPVLVSVSHCVLPFPAQSGRGQFCPRLYYIFFFFVCQILGYLPVSKYARYAARMDERSGNTVRNSGRHIFSHSSDSTPLYPRRSSSSSARRSGTSPSPTLV